MRIKVKYLLLYSVSHQVIEGVSVDGRLSPKSDPATVKEKEILSHIENWTLSSQLP